MNDLSPEIENSESTCVDSEMNLIEAIYARRSVRGFLDKEVPQSLLNRVFEIAQKTPSNCNVQPWKAYVASGELKDKLKQKMVENVTKGVEANPDYPYRSTFENEYRKRQVECAVALYSSMDIGRDDKEGRMRASLRNFEFFDAPYSPL